MYFNVALYIPEMFVLAKLKDFQGGRKTCCRWRGAFGVLVSGKDRLVWGFEGNCISKMPAEMRTALTANSCSSWDKAVLAKCVGFWETLETLAKNTHFLERLNILVTTLYWIGSEVVNVLLIVLPRPSTWSFMDACKALEALLDCYWLCSHVLGQKALLSQTF